MRGNRWAVGLARLLQHRRSAWSFLGLSVAATALAWWISDRAQAQRIRDQFIFRTVEIESAISRRMLEYEHVLRGGTGLFAASDGVTRREWRTYVETLRIDEYYPGIQGLGFSLRIPAGGADAHVAAVRAEGFPDYALRPPGPRPEQHAIVFLEPFTGRNLRAFGYDMFSEPVRRAAMERARDTGLPSISGVVTLVQETGKDVQRGFLMYVPVYRKGAPAGTPEERRAALHGFVYSPFRTRDLMAGILGNEIVDVDWWIHDGEPGGAVGELLFASEERAAWPPAGALSRTVAMHRAGRRWTLDFAPRPGWVSPEDRSQPLVVAVGGLLIDLLLFVIIAMQHRSATAAQAMAARSNASLREKEVLLKEVHHRVKNNLQVVSSLLALQGRRLGDPRSREILDQCRSRVQSMALVHEKLYRSADLSQVDLADYVGALLAELRRGQVDGKVQLVLRAEAVGVGLERAIPCGLILHELVSNAQKHAFPEGRGGRVEVVVRPAGERLELEVNDDGVGMTAQVDPSRPRSLGLEVVGALVGQLGAEMTVQREGGTRIRLSIPRAAQRGMAPAGGGEAPPVLS